MTEEKWKTNAELSAEPENRKMIDAAYVAINAANLCGFSEADKKIAGATAIGTIAAQLSNERS